MYLVCDHFVGTDEIKNDQLYMTFEEQRIALVEAGLTTVEQIMFKSDLVMHRALKSWKMCCNKFSKCQYKLQLSKAV